MVRLAAAGTLAFHGDASGAEELIAGLRYEEWEVRWWCGAALSALGDDDYGLAIAKQWTREPDGWVRGKLESMLAVFNRP